MTCPKTKIETENHPPWGSWTLQWKGFHEHVWRRGRVLKIARPLRVQWSLGHLKRKIIFQNLHFFLGGGFQAFVFRGEWQNCKWYPLSSLANVPNRVMFLDVFDVPVLQKVSNMRRSVPFILPKTDSSHLKMDGFSIFDRFLFGMVTFQQLSLLVSGSLFRGSKKKFSFARLHFKTPRSEAPSP